MNSVTDQRTGKDRRHDDIHLDAARVPLKFVASAVAFAAGLLMSYFASDNAATARVAAVNARVAVLESQQQTTKQSLDRIEDKVDRLIDLRLREIRIREQQ